MLNHVAPYRYMFPTVYLFVKYIANPDLSVYVLLSDPVLSRYRPYGVPSVSKVQKVHALFYKSACTFTIVRALFVKVNCKKVHTHLSF